MLKKAIGEVCMRRCVQAAEPAAWQLAWLRVRCHATAAVAAARGAGGVTLWGQQKQGKRLRRRRRGREA